MDMDKNNEKLNKEYEIIEVKDYSNIRLVLDAIIFGSGVAAIICSAIALNNLSSVEEINQLIDPSEISKKIEEIKNYKDVFGIGMLMGTGFSGIGIFDMYKIIYAKYPKIRKKLKKVYESIDNYSNNFANQVANVKQNIEERKGRRR